MSARTPVKAAFQTGWADRRSMNWKPTSDALTMAASRMGTAAARAPEVSLSAKLVSVSAISASQVTVDARGRRGKGGHPRR